MPDVSAFLIEDDFLASLVKRFESKASQRQTEEIHIPEDELTEALRIGRKYVEQWEKLENQISKEVRKTEENHGTTNVGEKSMNYPCRHASKPHDPEVAAESKEAAVYLVARKLGIPAEKIGDFPQTKNFRNGADDRQTCDATSKFRNIDGTCNNLAVPSYGKSGSIFSRLIVNSNEGYGDGIGAIRTSKLTKNPLPSPCSISTAVLVNDSVPNPAVTLLAMQWGQFLDHDLTLTPTFKNNDGKEFACCSTDSIGTTLLTTPHPECLPIIIPLNDSTYNPSVDGDGRVNEQPLLTVMHTIWLREHNRIAGFLYQFVPNQTDEYYYQHARRIVIAVMQHIIYTEYLPVIIGPTLAAQVMSPENGYYNGNPAVFTEFSLAAYRMGHSQTPAQAVDNSFAEDLTSQLFKAKGEKLGMDLISFNIQRGRDHGLPPYVSMLYYLASNFLLQTQPTSFDHLLPRTSSEVVSAMKSVYESVYDVDLYIGGVTEKPLPNAELGPTFAGIFAIQFLNLRRTDRFFYTNNIGQPTGFTSNQLEQIQKMSMARIICSNNDGTIKEIQPNVFRTPDELLNKRIPCNRITGIDWNYFLKI
ncbi:hypothetical protein DAPPUDRAFT_330268 [Daphnia pulex]|uniref:Uncharacterized protein n=1 Tax=Daphnia pulex TaxID=6669 RepID=E9HJ25_DAPPU|nr:hypothetical protein DAPPUDRAFT_330268 [Daphnia pulex]|eukprot:EFX68245.1 hypothetical protein DAPPUDRAFT_330268 [Daphnia pulex]